MSSRPPLEAVCELLEPQEVTEVVDIGANPVDGDPPYAKMLEAGLCRVTGFEPQPEAFARLQGRDASRERYFPFAVGDGGEHELKVCRGSGMTSLFEPDSATFDLFTVLKPYAEVLQRIPVRTRRLDDINDIEHLDFLKIDIQGGELAVFQSGRNKLERAVVIQTEVSFVNLYEGQPTLGEVDGELRAQGFIPHAFAKIKLWPIAPCVVDGDPSKPINQLLEADMVYVRDFSRPERFDNEQMKQLALIAHCCYRSLDLTMRCIDILDERKAASAPVRERYMQLLSGR